MIIWVFSYEQIEYRISEVCFIQSRLIAAHHLVKHDEVPICKRSREEAVIVISQEFLTQFGGSNPRIQNAPRPGIFAFKFVFAYTANEISIDSYGFNVIRPLLAVIV